MSFDYSAIKSTAGDLLTRFGRSMTLKQETEGAYDPSTGTYGDGTESTESFTGVMVDFSADEIDGTLIKVGDKRVIGQLSTLTPAVGDVIADSVDYRVERIIETKPGDTTVLYEFQARI